MREDPDAAGGQAGAQPGGQPVPAPALGQVLQRLASLQRSRTQFLPTASGNIVTDAMVASTVNHSQDPSGFDTCHQLLMMMILSTSDKLSDGNP